MGHQPQPSSTNVARETNNVRMKDLQNRYNSQYNYNKISIRVNRLFAKRYMCSFVHLGCDAYVYHFMLVALVLCGLTIVRAHVYFNRR